MVEPAARRVSAPFVFGHTLKVTPEMAYHVPTHHPATEGPSPFAHILRCMPHTNSGMTHAVARGNGMREKVLEAFSLLRLRREEHRQLLAKVRRAVEEAAPFSSYDDYVELACTLIPLEP